VQAASCIASSNTQLAAFQALDRAGINATSIQSRLPSVGRGAAVICLRATGGSPAAVKLDQLEAGSDRATWARVTSQ
jgi:hypothetical protein